FVIDQVNCIRCGLCKEACAFEAVLETNSRYLIERSSCTQCKACFTACPVDAVLIKKQRHVTLEEVLKVPTESIEIIDRRARMILRDLLKNKPSEVITVQLHSKANEAVKLMADKNVSDVIVVDENGKLAGIFTERDVVKHIHHKVCLEDELIENLMTSKVITFAPSTEISTAIQIVAKEKIRHLPVVEGDTILGVITYRDLVAHVLPEVIYMAEAIY
ncbi:CBS domain-containing protein, partial [bacterium]|nr:CBS domain-containing protein [bacterium]